MARTDADGQVTVSLEGIRAGADRLLASVDAGDTSLTSNAARMTWEEGEHLSSLDLEPGPKSATLGESVTLFAGLADISADPAVGGTGRAGQLRSR